MKHKKQSNILKRIFFIILVLIVAVAIGVGIYAYSLINNPDYITLGVGESYTIKPANKDYLIRTYNADVMSPTSADTVSATSAGNAVVCVKYTYFKRDFYRFVVVDAPQSVGMNTSELSLGVNETATLSAKCYSGTHKFPVKFSSSDESIATVSENGEVSAVNVGECEIYAKAYNGVSSICTLQVYKAPSSIKLSETDITLGQNEEVPITPVFNNDEYCNNVEFYSSDDSVAKVLNKNEINGIAPGECTIFARTYNGITAKCTVTVKEMPDKISLLMLDKYSIGTDINLRLHMDKDCAAHNVEVSVSDENILKPDDKNPTLLHTLTEGTATVTVTLSNGVKATKDITVGNYSKSNIKFNILNQFPTLPTGCEVVSLTSVLNHYGFDVGMTTMADEYMPRYDGAYYEVSPHDYFLGTPYTWDGFGCFSGCVVKTAHNYFEDKNIDDYVAVDITGCSADELYNYLSNDIPVITWVTSGFVTPTNDGSWTVDGETITWCNHEHCLVTTGNDKKAGTVTVADNSGGYSYAVSMSQFERVFNGMGNMAVVVLKK